jgi:hypothetical protein
MRYASEITVSCLTTHGAAPQWEEKEPVKMQPAHGNLFEARNGRVRRP